MDKSFGEPFSYSHLTKFFFLGWSWGLGYFCAGLWWLSYAFFNEGGTALLLMPFALLAFYAFLALFFGLGAAIAGIFWSRSTFRILAFAIGLSCTEWLRSILFTGFPWNLPGIALAQNIYFLQTASLGGIHLLTFLSFFIFALPATLLITDNKNSSLIWGPSLLACFLLLCLWIFGFYRLPDENIPIQKNIKFRIMQPNIQQDKQFNHLNAQKILTNYIDTTLNGKNSIPDEITHILWPETAFPFILDYSPEAVSQISELLSENRYLLSGAIRLKGLSQKEEDMEYYNSIALVTKNERVSWLYDKEHLVPFGEYIPDIFIQIAQWIGFKQFVDLPGNYNYGMNQTSFYVPLLGEISGSICYEAIFPDSIKSSNKEGNRSIKLILNVTNDGWFGSSPGPYQHFAQSRLRSVEEGLPLIRAANTGKSAVIDPYGRIMAQTQLNEIKILDSFIPNPLEKKTLYSLLRQKLFLFILFTGGLLCFLQRKFRSQ